MSKPNFQISLQRIGKAAFRARSGTGGELLLDGSPDIGGEGRGMRPMELLLTAIASCASLDVVHILQTKQRQPLEDLEVFAEGERKDATPAPFTKVHLRFVAHGAVDPQKLERAVALSVEKYCSVKDSLDPAIQVTWEAALAPA
jgi:putative redox protein